VNARAALAGLRFTKMHGAGNDFVLLDGRSRLPQLTPELLSYIADRRSGVGFDQLLTVEPPREPGSALYYGIWNTDGSHAAQCGNGARCVAAWALRAGVVEGEQFRMDSPSGTVAVRVVENDEIEVELGVPDFRAKALPARGYGAPDGVIELAGSAFAYRGVSMGNPHALIEVPDVAAAPVAEVGSALQADARFPDSVNVGFAQVLSSDHIRLRVFERGVGETLACGSGACAAVAVLHRRERVDACAGVAVDLPGGRLVIHWDGPEHAVRMRGPAVFVYEGEFCP
jgi:diaminopimelate epimerase